MIGSLRSAIVQEEINECLKKNVINKHCIMDKHYKQTFLYGDMYVCCSYIVPTKKSSVVINSWIFFLFRHKEMAPHKYMALEQKLRNDPRLAEYF